MRVGDRVRVFQDDTFAGHATIVKVLNFDAGSIDTWYTDLKFDLDDTVYQRYVRERDITKKVR